MKRMTKRLCLLLVALLLLPTLTACPGGQQLSPGKATSGQEGSGEVTSDVREGGEIPAAELSSYVIIYPADAEQELVSAAAKLAKAIRETYGVVIYVTDDFVVDGIEETQPREREILIGATNRQESVDFLASLRANDHGWRLSGTKLVIAGRTGENSILATDRFIYAVLAEKRDVFYSDGTEAFLFTDDYSVPRILIGETDVSEFSIVCPAGVRNAELAAAEVIRDAIADQCGALIPIVRDSLAESQEYEILIGNTNRHAPTAGEGRFSVGTVGGKPYCTGSEPLAVWYAACELAAQIRSMTSERLTVRETTQTVPDEQITLMSWNLCQQHAFTTARMNAFIAQIRAQAPAVVFLEEARLTEAERSTLLTGIGSNYANAISPKQGDPKSYFNSLNKEMYYNTDLLTLVWSDYFWLSETPEEPSTFQYASDGYRDCVSACFERKSDGKRFIVVTFHPEWTTTDEMREQGMTDRSMRAQQYAVASAYIARYRAENPGVPVFLGGDFNAQWTSSGETMFTAIRNEGYRNASEAAFVSVEGGTFPKTGLVIDFIFCDSKDVCFTYYEAVQLGIYVNDKTDPGTNPADHNPVIAKFIFR